MLSPLPKQQASRSAPPLAVSRGRRQERLYLERFWKAPDPAASADRKIIVEHTNINPYKAAHIGHLRNAALGDTFVRVLRYLKDRVEIQNYIDDTGVQVADVVVGFLHLEKKTAEEVQALAKPKLDLTKLPFDPLEYVEHLDQLPFDPNMDPDLGKFKSGSRGLGFVEPPERLPSTEYS